MSSSVRNFLPMLVVTCELYGGWNHVTCRFLRCLLLVEWLHAVGLYLSLYLQPLFSRASWYTGAAWLKVGSLEDIFDSLLLMLSGMLRNMGCHVCCHNVLVRHA